MISCPQTHVLEFLRVVVRFKMRGVENENERENTKKDKNKDNGF